MSDINMPKLSDTMEEGTVIEWKKKTGDAVKKGEVLAEVESDKASFELESDADGVLSIVVDAGKAVPVGEVIANIGKEGDKKPDPKAKPEEPEAKPDPKAKAEEPEAKPNPKAKPDPKAEEEEPEGDAPSPEELAAEPAEQGAAAAAPVREGGEGRIKASPIAARLAAEMGVDLAALKGSGPEGRIVKEDVLAASRQSPGSRPAARPAATRTGPEVEHEELTRMQTIVARRMVESKTTVPHFYLTTEVRMDEAVRIQKQLRETVTGADKLTISDLVMRACALALRRHPNVNASWAGDHIEVKRRINIGFAVAQPKGLVVPVLKDADAKDVVQISIESRQLIERARAGKPSPQDLEGGTFSISNLGMFGITDFAAVVNLPEAAILAIGAVTDRAVVADGQVMAGKLMQMTLSVDHRVLYGADGAQFLAEVRRLLENPVSLVLPPEA